MKLNYLLDLFGKILLDQAENIKDEDITDPVAIKTWYWFVELTQTFFPEYRKLGFGVGKIIAYRMQNDEEFRKKVLEVISHASEITKE